MPELKKTTVMETLNKLGIVEGATFNFIVQPISICIESIVIGSKAIRITYSQTIRNRSLPNLPGNIAGLPVLVTEKHTIH